MSERDPNTGSGWEATGPLVRLNQTFWLAIIIYFGYFVLISAFTFFPFILFIFFGILCIPGTIIWAGTLNFLSWRARALSPLSHVVIATASALIGEGIAYFLADPLISFFSSRQTGRVDPEGELVGQGMIQLLPVGTILVFPILALILRYMSPRIALRELFFPPATWT